MTRVLHVGNAPDPHREQLFPPGLWSSSVDTGSAASLSSSGGSSWAFARSDRGWSLTSFTRPSGATWTNQERSLWKLTVFPVGRWAGAKTSDSVTIEPSNASLVDARFASSYATITYRVRIYDSVLQIRTFLAAKANHLQAQLHLEWITKANDCTVDGACVLPLLLDPRDRGSDEACLGALKGHVVVDPIPRFGYRPEQSGQPKFGWLAQRRQSGTTTAGRGISMALWGYYSTLDKEGWTTWIDQAERQVCHAIYESDRSRMLFELWAPCEDWAKVHNGDRAIIKSPILGLRPFLATSAYGWWDVADLYRQRMVAIAAPFAITPKIMLDSTRDDYERAPHLIVSTNGSSGGNTLGDEGQMTPVPGYLRTNLALSSATAMFGLNYGPANDDARHLVPGASQINGTTSRPGLIAAHGTLAPSGVFWGLQKPASFFPEAGECGYWADGQYLDVWANLSLVKHLFTSRQGFLDGDTDETRATAAFLEFATYYREKSYVVQSTSSANKRITVTTFSGDGWKGGIAYIGAAISFLGSDGRSYWAEIDSVSGTQITLNDHPYDYTGSSAYPAAGTTVRVHDRQTGVEYCPYAVSESSTMDFFERYFAEQLARDWGYTLLYLDVLPQAVSREACSSAHTGLGVTHPQGGGTWFVEARRKIFERLQRGLACGRQPNIGWVGGEYLDETFLPYYSFGVHTYGKTDLWRTFESSANDPDFNDPDDHGMRPVPMWSVCYAGKAYGLQTVFSMGNGILADFIRNDSVLPTDAPKFRRVHAWWAGGEWVYGLTPPQWVQTYSTTITVNGSPMQFSNSDLWDAAQYTGANAAVAEVATIRDYYANLVSAEMTWALTYLRNGQLLAPLALGGSTTLFDIYTTGIFDQAGAALGNIPINFRSNLPVLWDPHNYPRVQHQVWKAWTGSSVCVLMTNPTDTSGTLAATVDLTQYGLTGEVYAFRITASNGSAAFLGSFWSTYSLSETVGAYSSGAIIFCPESEIETVRIRSDLTDSPPVQVKTFSHLSPLLAIEVDVLDGGVPVNLAAATTKQLIGTFPSGISLIAPASNVTNGTDGRIRAFLTAQGLRADSGTWTIGARVNIGAGLQDGSRDQIQQNRP